jgi:hypothetical protein
MTHDQQLLRLARRAWQADQPSEEQIEAAVRRVARRIRLRRATRRSRGPSLLVAFAVVALGALAYAAAHRTSSQQSRKPAPAPTVQAPSAVPGPALESPEQTAHAGEPETLSLESVAEQSAGLPGGARRPAGSRVAREVAAPPEAEEGEAEEPSSSWREVDDALGAKDDARAARALSELAAADDPTTRIKARLGLAQLAASRGNCERARDLAQGILAEPNLDAVLARRAERILGQCR